MDLGFEPSIVNAEAKMLFITPVFFAACQSDKSEQHLPNAAEEAEEWSFPVLAELDEAIANEMLGSHVPGLAACLIKAGQTVWCNGYGYADLEAERLVNSQTPFMLASVSKTVTGVALMQLIDENALALDTSINEILDFEVHHPDDTQAMTPRLLMSHASGIADNWNVMGTLYADGDSPIELQSFLEGYLTPGGQWYNADRNFLSSGVASEIQYSNIGVALAGHLVEAVTGEAFSTVTENHIFAPLEMSQTGWFMADFEPDTVAVPYEWGDGEWRRINHYGYPDYPDGSLRTGAEQLSQFLKMFSNGGQLGDALILSEDAVSEMSRAHYPELDSEQGLIWYQWIFDGQSIIGHNGGDIGVSTEMGLREDGVGFVILMNASGRANTLSRIESMLFEAADGL